MEDNRVKQPGAVTLSGDSSMGSRTVRGYYDRDGRWFADPEGPDFRTETLGGIDPNNWKRSRGAARAGAITAPLSGDMPGQLLSPEELAALHDQARYRNQLLSNTKLTRRLPDPSGRRVNIPWSNPNGDRTVDGRLILARPAGRRVMTPWSNANGDRTIDGRRILARPTGNRIMTPWSNANGTLPVNVGTAPVDVAQEIINRRAGLRNAPARPMRIAALRTATPLPKNAVAQAVSANKPPLAAETLTDLMKPYLGQTDPQIASNRSLSMWQQLQGARVGFGPTTYPGGQRTIEAFNTLQAGDGVHIFDLELFPMFKHDAASGTWAKDGSIVTEFAMHRYLLQSNGALNPVTSQSHNLLGGMNADQATTLKKWATELRLKGRIPTAEERVSLDRLVKYADATIRMNGTIESFADTAPNFGTQRFWDKVEAGIGVLSRRSKGIMTQDVLATRINGAMGAVAQHNEVLMGHNILGFDLPKLHEMMDQHKLKLKQPARVMDTLPLMTLTTSNPLDLHKGLTEELKHGAFTLDAFRQTYGQSFADAHAASADVDFLAHVWSNVFPTLQENVQKGRGGDGKFSYLDQRAKAGDWFLATRGGRDARDRILDMTTGDDVTDSFKGTTIFSRTHYRAIDEMHHDDGRASLLLFNDDDRYMHVLTRDSKEELQDTIHSIMQYKGDTVDQKERDVMNASHLMDRSRREYDKMHANMEGSQQFKRTHDVYRVMNEFTPEQIHAGEADSALREAYGWSDKSRQWHDALDSQLEKLKAMSGRLKSDAEFMLPAMDKFKALPPNQQMRAMYNLRQQLDNEYGRVLEPRDLMDFEARTVDIGGHKINVDSPTSINSGLWNSIGQDAKKGVNLNREGTQRNNFLRLVAELESNQALGEGVDYGYIRGLTGHKDGIGRAVERAAEVIYAHRNNFTPEDLTVEAITQGRVWGNISGEDRSRHIAQAAKDANLGVFSYSKDFKLTGDMSWKLPRLSHDRDLYVEDSLRWVTQKYQDQGLSVAVMEHGGTAANEFKLSLAIFDPSKQGDVFKNMRDRDALMKHAAVIDLPMFREEKVGYSLIEGGNRKMGLLAHLGAGNFLVKRDGQGNATGVLTPEEISERLGVAFAKQEAGDSSMMARYRKDSLSEAINRIWVSNKKIIADIQAKDYGSASRSGQNAVTRVMAALSSTGDPTGEMGINEIRQAGQVSYDNLMPVFYMDYLRQKDEKAIQAMVDGGELAADLMEEAKQKRAAVRLKMAEQISRLDDIKDMHALIVARGGSGAEFNGVLDFVRANKGKYGLDELAYHVRVSEAENFRIGTTDTKDLVLFGQQIVPNRESSGQSHTNTMLHGERKLAGTNLTKAPVLTQAAYELESKLSESDQTRALSGRVLVTDDAWIAKRTNDLLSDHAKVAEMRDIFGRPNASLDELRQRLRPFSSVYEQNIITSESVAGALDTVVRDGFEIDAQDLDLIEDRRLLDALVQDENGRVIGLKAPVRIDAELVKDTASPLAYVPGRQRVGIGEMKDIEIANPYGSTITNVVERDGKLAVEMLRDLPMREGGKAFVEVDKGTISTMRDRLFRMFYGNDVDAVFNPSLKSHGDVGMVQSGMVKLAQDVINRKGGSLDEFTELKSIVERTYGWQGKTKIDEDSATGRIRLLTPSAHTDVTPEAVDAMFKEFEAREWTVKHEGGRVYMWDLARGKQNNTYNYSRQLNGVRGESDKGMQVSWREYGWLENQDLRYTASVMKAEAEQKNAVAARTMQGVRTSFGALHNPDELAGLDRVAASELHGLNPRGLVDEAMIHNTILNPVVGGQSLLGKFNEGNASAYVLDMTDVDWNHGLKRGEKFRVGGKDFSGNLVAALGEVGRDFDTEYQLRDHQFALNRVHQAYTNFKKATGLPEGERLPDHIKTTGDAANELRAATQGYYDQGAKELLHKDGMMWNDVVKTRLDNSARGELGIHGPLLSAVHSKEASRGIAEEVARRTGGDASAIVAQMNQQITDAAKQAGGQHVGFGTLTVGAEHARRLGLNDGDINDIYHGKRDMFAVTERYPAFHEKSLVPLRLQIDGTLDEHGSVVSLNPDKAHRQVIDAATAALTRGDQDGDEISSVVIRDAKAQAELSQRWHSNEYQADLYTAYQSKVQERMDNLSTEQQKKAVLNFEDWGRFEQEEGKYSPYVQNFGQFDTTQHALQKQFTGPISNDGSRLRQIAQAAYGTESPQYAAAAGFTDLMEQKAAISAKHNLEFLGHTAQQFLKARGDDAKPHWDALAKAFPKLGGENSNWFQLLDEVKQYTDAFDPAMNAGLGGKPTAHSAMRALGYTDKPVMGLPNMQMMLNRLGADSQHLQTPAQRLPALEVERIAQETGVSRARVADIFDVPEAMSESTRAARAVRAAAPETVFHQIESAARGEAGDTIFHTITSGFGSGREMLDSLGPGGGKGLLMMGAIGAGAVALASAFSGGGRSVAPLLPENKLSLQNAPPPPPPMNPNGGATTRLEQGDPEGYEMRVRGRTSGRQPVGSMVSETLRQSGVNEGNVQVTERDDTTPLTKEWVQGMVSGLLR